MNVKHEPDRRRFVVGEGQSVAQLVYHRDDDRLYLLHTEVPEDLEGRGIGSALVKAALELARSEKRIIVPWCPFARQWIRDNVDPNESVVIDWTPPPPRPAA
jgi:predicted GNAT family acetyltransferase